jgi:hypothetical protein
MSQKGFAPIIAIIIGIFVIGAGIIIYQSYKIRNIISPGACTDSDGGKNYYVRGTVSYNGQTYTDECGMCTGARLSKGPSPSPHCLLKEYYCDNNQVKSIWYNCPFGFSCESGRCPIPSISSLLKFIFSRF